MRHAVEHVYQRVSTRTLAAGIEYWQLLLFSEPLVPLFGSLLAGTLVVNTRDLEAGAGRFWDDACARFGNRYVNPIHPLLPPETL